MKTLRPFPLMIFLLVFACPVNGEDAAAFEKIRDKSPDGKVAVRVSCSGEPQDPDNIDSNLITGVDIVSLPSNEVVLKLDQDYEGNAPRVMWSPDSKWFAFPLSDGPRVTYTHVYHRSGDKFSEFKTDNLQVDAKGDVRNEYITPVCWVRAGVLELEQFDIFRGEDGEDATYRFTAQFDEKTGMFRIVSKKKVPSKE